VLRIDRPTLFLHADTGLCRRDFDVGYLSVSLRWHCSLTALTLG